MLQKVDETNWASTITFPIIGLITYKLIGIIF